VKDEMLGWDFTRRVRVKKLLYGMCATERRYMWQRCAIFNNRAVRLSEVFVIGKEKENSAKGSIRGGNVFHGSVENEYLKYNIKN